MKEGRRKIVVGEDGKVDSGRRERERSVRERGTGPSGIGFEIRIVFSLRVRRSTDSSGNEFRRRMAFVRYLVVTRGMICVEKSDFFET